MTTTARDLLTVLNASHERLAAALTPLSDEDAAAPSYDDDWNIGQVASHLGSGAEIFGLVLEAGVSGDPTPGPDRFQAIWAEWDAKSPAEQVRDAIPADRGFLDRVAALSDEQVERWRLQLFGTEQGLEGVLRMRLSEHAVHTWDIAVMADPALALPADATELLIDRLDSTVGRAAKPNESHRVRVTTTDPAREYLLELESGEARLTSADTAGDDAARLTLPAEAFIRLVYGRLDPEHTPAAVKAEGIDLQQLRAAFPGF